MKTQLRLILASAFFLGLSLPGVSLAEPQCGDVFREYAWTTEKFHVLGLSQTPFELPAELDLVDATRAEVVIEIANQHLGFEGMAIRLNGNQWSTIPFPELSPKDPSPSLWFHHWHPTIPIALTDLKEGQGNTFEMKVPAECFDGKVHPNGKVTADRPLGEWGPLIPWCPIDSVTVRVYYDPARKPHLTGKVLSPIAQSTVGLTVELTASAKSDNGPIRQVDFLGRYEDINYEGDGIYHQWHGHLFHGKITHHLGSTTHPAGKVTWDTSWVPDQPGPMEIAARIVDSTGLIYMTEAVGGLTLVRPGLSVELCKPFDVPRSFTGCQYGEWVIPGVRSQKFTITGDLSRIQDARYVIASWGGQTLCHGYQINGVLLEDKPAGADWLYNLSTPPIRPLTALKPGENTFSTVVGEGRVPDIYLPGVQVLIRYRTDEAATTSARRTSTAAASSQAEGKQKPKKLPQLRVSDNHRFLVTIDGKPFFWLGDTAWELFHRLNREETERYLADRAAKGFNVIQAVALAELDGLTVPNPQGHLPLVEGQFLQPAVVEGPDNDYWDNIEWTLRLAERKGLYVGLLPMWGKYCPADTGNCERYGRFIGERFKDHTHIIWILGGDRPAPSKQEQDAWRAMARGIAIGVSGREDYDRVLMTYHTFGPDGSSKYFHEDSWLDFNGIQSSHGNAILNWKMIERDYRRQPTKPVIDLETSYPGIGLNNMAPGDEDHARRSAYWAVFSGAFGHTYGNNSIWQMYAPNRDSLFGVKTFWQDALDAPSAVQMGHVRRLIESRPFLTQVPDPTLLSTSEGDDLEHVAVLRGDGYALFYAPTGKPFRVRLERLSGKPVSARWFDPRTGKSSDAGQCATEAEREFTPPGNPGVGNDWVLMLTAYDWSTREWKSYFNHDGLQYNNNRWAGEMGSMYVRFGPSTATWWTTHNGNRADFPVSAPWVSVGSDWGNVSSNSPFPIKLGEIELLKASLSASLPPAKSDQMYKIYWQLYFSDSPTGKFNKGDFAPTVYAVRFPSNHWGVARGSATIDGRQWGFKDQQYSSGMGRYIIPMLEPALAPDANGVVEIRDVDIKAMIDWCLAQGYYSPEDYCMVIGAGWEIFVLDEVLKMNDMAFTIKQKGKPAVTIPSWSTLMTNGNMP